MKIINYEDKKSKELVKKILSRSTLENKAIQEKVDDIIKNVKERGDEAVFEYTEKFDSFKLDTKNILVSEEEKRAAYEAVDSDLVRVIVRSAERIRAFHEKQKLNTWLEPSKSGEMLGQLIRPLDRVGVYVPGGKAAYPSSVLMNVIPAEVAGVEDIVMVTPPSKDGSISPTTIVAADVAGVDKIYKVGGAQAVAALAFGTETIPKADKIVGPGNIFVALAKRSVYGYVNIDSVAGPSEILVLADESADPSFVAADLLSQAEHDEMASAVLITTDKTLAENVDKCVREMTEKLERKEIIEKSLENYGAIIIAKDMDEAIALSNAVAPEHMEVCTREPFEYLPKIKNAGAIFLGHYTPEPLGDYMAGPNHVLPTGGTARFFSPLSIDDYIKKSSILYFDKNSFTELSEDVIKFAEAEGLTAHANSIKVRKGK
ncbi:MAG: histidinol dehydrogenase [Firmicutes bacterium]|nr:histidinol dehydrogenase [Bacillota bacterium]